MTRLSSAPLALLLALTACSVAEVPQAPSELALNECDSNDDCAGGSCADGACVARSSELHTVIVEVTPPPGEELPPLPYYTVLGEKLSDDILLQPPATVTGYVTLHPENCPPTFVGDAPGDQDVPVQGTIPVKATFTPSNRALGLPARTYEAESFAPVVGDPNSKYGFTVVVPPGDYDVYLEPPPTLDVNCQIPPWLLLRQHIAASGPYDVKLSLASRITVPIHWPTASLDLSTVDLLDSVSGRVLSAPVKLGAPGLDDDKMAFYQATATYSRVLEPNGMNELVVSPSSYELVRITPPEGAIGPTILGDVGAIGLSASNSGGILLTSPLPQPVQVEAQTAVGNTTTYVPAAVTVTATRLEGMDQGLFGSFVRTYQVNPKGLFHAILPPGDYIVDSIPKVSSAACPGGDCPPLAARRDVWQVGASPSVQAGKLIQFQPAPTLQGTAYSVTGRAMSGAVVRVRPSTLSPPSDVWNHVDREGTAIPLGTTTVVGTHGAFDLNADPGTFELLVQPDPSSRFGWYVRPQLKVADRDDVVPIGQLTVPLARRYAGHILVGPKLKGQPTLPNALIRAYVYVTPRGEYAAAPVANGSVIQVAETRSNGGGEFELLIPASLDSPPPTAD